MNSDHVATTERAGRVGQRRAEAEAVLDAQRRRSLPGWLSTRRNRRTLALLPVVVLVAAMVGENDENPEDPGRDGPGMAVPG